MITNFCVFRQNGQFLASNYNSNLLECVNTMVWQLTGIENYFDHKSLQKAVNQKLSADVERELHHSEFIIRGGKHYYRRTIKFGDYDGMIYLFEFEKKERKTIKKY